MDTIRGCCSSCITSCIHYCLPCCRPVTVPVHNYISNEATDQEKNLALLKNLHVVRRRRVRHAASLEMVEAAKPRPHFKESLKHGLFKTALVFSVPLLLNGFIKAWKENSIDRLDIIFCSRFALNSNLYNVTSWLIYTGLEKLGYPYVPPAPSTNQFVKGLEAVGGLVGSVLTWGAGKLGVEMPASISEALLETPDVYFKYKACEYSPNTARAFTVMNRGFDPNTWMNWGLGSVAAVGMILAATAFTYTAYKRSQAQQRGAMDSALKIFDTGIRHVNDHIQHLDQHPLDRDPVETTELQTGVRGILENQLLIQAEFDRHAAMGTPAVPGGAVTASARARARITLNTLFNKCARIMGGAAAAAILRHPVPPAPLTRMERTVARLNRLAASFDRPITLIANLPQRVIGAVVNPVITHCVHRRFRAFPVIPAPVAGPGIFERSLAQLGLSARAVGAGGGVGVVGGYLAVAGRTMRLDAAAGLADRFTNPIYRVMNVVYEAMKLGAGTAVAVEVGGALGLAFPIAYAYRLTRRGYYEGRDMVDPATLPPEEDD